jgi:hypothetical protein
VAKVAEEAMEKESAIAVPERSGFRLSCDAGAAGQFRADTDSVLVTISQRIHHLDTRGLWDSVTVEAKPEQDGTLGIRVLVSNPDWDERLQIACIRSRPDDPDCLTALGTNLDHIQL